jgi:carnitine 3-dehydrogenase
MRRVSRTIAIIGTGVIGASWAAHYLARGFTVVGSDPAPAAEERLRARVDEFWATLETLGLDDGASRNTWFLLPRSPMPYATPSSYRKTGRSA